MRVSSFCGAPGGRRENRGGGRARTKKEESELHFQLESVPFLPLAVAEALESVCAVECVFAPTQR